MRRYGYVACCFGVVRCGRSATAEVGLLRVDYTCYRLGRILVRVLTSLSAQ
jgi:hypothetical protein